MAENDAAEALARWLAEPDAQRDHAEDPYEHVTARAAEIAAFALGLRDAPREQWREHDLVTLDLMYRELAESTARPRVMAIAFAEEWLKLRATADPAALLAGLAQADRKFAGLVLTADELKMLRGERDFEAVRVVAALALRCGALDLEPCDHPLARDQASTLEAAWELLRKARSRYRSK